ncbi:hypothetical protein VTK73DRAFT_5150 [Phialemonium thermophilum]|uniref:Uncharacterized protein n=1 Tax=Phialemonium thermophilum TaxID=223376 RepID=A0ABR3XXP1_9PEZI
MGQRIFISVKRGHRRSQAREVGCLPKCYLRVLTLKKGLYVIITNYPIGAAARYLLIGGGFPSDFTAIHACIKVHESLTVQLTLHASSHRRCSYSYKTLVTGCISRGHSAFTRPGDESQSRL